MAPLRQRVDPRPAVPPKISLLGMANIVINGSDEDWNSNARINTPIESDSQHLLNDPLPTNEPGSDYEAPRIGAPVKWIRGFSYRPEVCDGGGIMDPEGSSINAADSAESEIDVVPFLVEGTDSRSTFGAPTQGEYAEARDYAHRQLLSCQSKQIEHELWHGTQSLASGWGNRFLSDVHVDMVEGDRLLGYITALAVLERAIDAGTCGAQGMIHARADTVSIWDTGGALRRVGDLILTIHDTIVVPGSGYDGSAPVAGTPGIDPNHAGRVPSSDSAWAYATTVPDIRLSACEQPQPILERLATSTNLLTTYERRVAAATWGCLQIGVHVDHTQALTTTGS